MAMHTKSLRHDQLRQNPHPQKNRIVPTKGISIYCLVFCARAEGRSRHADAFYGNHHQLPISDPMSLNVIAKAANAANTSLVNRAVHII
eukprot:6467232-Amphidinium_carterae.1